jgi:hypothetical protein
MGFSGHIRLFKKNVRKGDPTPVNSPVNDRRRLTAHVEVHWARRVQAPMPKISGPNIQENQIIETCKEEGCAVYTQETAALREWETEHLTPLSAPWTDSHSHPRITNQLAGCNDITSIFENCSPTTARRGGCHSALSKKLSRRKCQLKFGRT